MTQTTEAMSGAANYIAISTDAGVTWSDISGYSGYVDVTPQTRDMGAYKTFDGETPVITAGKLNPMDVTVRVLYTEDLSAPYSAFLAAHHTAGGGAVVQVRWAPKGNTAGNFQFTTDYGSKIMSLSSAPTADIQNGNPILVEAKIHCGSIDKATITT